MDSELLSFPSQAQHDPHGAQSSALRDVSANFERPSEPTTDAVDSQLDSAVLDGHRSWVPSHRPQDGSIQLSLSLSQQSEDTEFKSVPSPFVRPHFLQISPASHMRLVPSHDGYERKHSELEETMQSFPDPLTSISRTTSSRSAHRLVVASSALSNEKKSLDSDLKNDILNASTINLRPASAHSVAQRRSPLPSQLFVRGAHDPSFAQYQARQRFQLPGQAETALKKLIRDQV
jgi:hypothetical protein